jgi:triacylglycerol lipase
MTRLLGAIDNPYTVLISDIINLRSSGVKDLGRGRLRREDWEGVEAGALLQSRQHPVPLLPHIRHHLIAGTLSRDPGLALLFGDALVPVSSATGRPRAGAPLSSRHVRIIPEVHHVGLAHDERVWAQLRAWCGESLP